jgi:hypothetical protein
VRRDENAMARRPSKPFIVAETVYYGFRLWFPAQ